MTNLLSIAVDFVSDLVKLGSMGTNCVCNFVR